MSMMRAKHVVVFQEQSTYRSYLGGYSRRVRSPIFLCLVVASDMRRFGNRDVELDVALRQAYHRGADPRITTELYHKV